MSRNSIAAACILGIILGGPLLGAKKKWQGPPEGSVEVSSFVVVVNANNPIEQLPSAVISDYFFKKKETWPNGLQIVPVDQRADNKVRSIFTLVVHFKPLAVVQSYWQQKIQAGELDPPPELADDVEVLEFVSQNPGAIGYVSGDWKLSAEVKALQVTQ